MNDRACIGQLSQLSTAINVLDEPKKGRVLPIRAVLDVGDVCVIITIDNRAFSAFILLVSVEHTWIGNMNMEMLSSMR